MKKRNYAFVAIASYLTFLIATIPAKPITDLISESAPVNIQGVGGTLWNGKAYSIRIDNIQLTKTQWSFNPLDLFAGKVSVDLSTQFLNEAFNAEIGSSFFGRLFVNQLSAKIAAHEIARLAKIPLAQLDGMISIDIQSASWKQGELPIANGKIEWREAMITVAETASLGDVTVVLTESDDQLNAEIKNQEGDIIISGNATLLSQSDYTVDITLQPTATASDNLQQSLGFFAQKQPNGEFLLKKSGSLNEIM